MKRILLLSCALVLAACADNATDTDEVVIVEDAPTATAEMPAETVPAEMAVTLSDPYIMAPLKGRDVAAGYLTAVNSGASGAIVAAQSPNAADIELHTHTMEDGVMKMREVEAIDLPTGETVTLEPGGLHLMLFGFTRDEGQATVPVTLTLTNGETMDVDFPIRDRD
ncbi:copper chaperone PCu(A)C [uncultured Algimonas sp.]|uniref:copper chaperone PCu(A)C n=1 Tax=uncultured Algimonas sp. TaxID=1547920 RepID=UPI00260F278F|nr:copper chaperone PCu(A)C [uncultured Algimonas sp.]